MLLLLKPNPLNQIDCGSFAGKSSGFAVHPQVSLAEIRKVPKVHHRQKGHGGF